MFGRSREVVEALLQEEGRLDDPCESPLADQVRDYVANHEGRGRYVDTAMRWLGRTCERPSEGYDIVLIGAGVHAAAFLYTLRRTGSPLRTVVVEKSHEICSTFARLGDALVLNSPTFSKVGLNANVVPGHFVQLSDFDELAETPFPTAKHLHELATMVHLHADADIRFGFEVEALSRATGGYEVASRDRRVRAKCVVVCNGLGAPKTNAFSLDRRSDRVIFGDDLLSRCWQDPSFAARLEDQRVAVIGAGDTANCVMERLLPLAYPNEDYGLSRAPTPRPRSIVWIGQKARHIRDYFFANKTRYCHSGGLIELFWDGDDPFELSYQVWMRAKNLVRLVPERLRSLVHRPGALVLGTESETIEVDFVIDCTGRFNALASRMQRLEYRFVEGDIRFHGGRWDDEVERFTAAPKTLTGKRIAGRLAGERIFFLGCANSLCALIDDDEARNGSLAHQEERTSLSNSKWSLEHTLPRSVALAEQFGTFGLPAPVRAR
ncbi:MAG: hypothetical protein AAGA48_18585 [Myxococcota bacterium]